MQRRCQLAETRLPGKENKHPLLTIICATCSWAGHIQGKDHLMNAIDILKYGQLTVLQAMDSFPETAWETPGACGIWSVKDIIAHLASYECVLEEVLSTCLGSPHSPTPYLTRYTDPGSQFNDTEVEKRKNKSRREVLEEFNNTHAQVMSMVGTIPSETL